MTGASVLPAGLAETHTAIVVFFGDRAYKIKKPVALEFLDFSTRAQREIACHEEVRLNRRLAPDVYLGVADILDPDGQPCDHAVVMRRMAPEHRLASMVERGDDVDAALRHVAHALATLHEARSPDDRPAGVGSVDQLRHNWQDNFHVLRAHPELEPEAQADVEDLAVRYLDGRAALFDRRVERGAIRDGHGDLLADDIFVLADGPRILDCLDFDERLRWGDVLLDAAFLAMDLERLGRPDLGERFLRWHREFYGDEWPPSLASHYVAYRAHVRAKVAAIRYGQGDLTAATAASQLLGLARGRLQQARVRMVLVGGPPGTGKSTVAAALAERLPWVVLRTDEIRASTAPVRSDPSRYAPDVVRATYDELLRQARELLAVGESVVLDATWGDATLRDEARAIAAGTASDVIELCCDAPVDICDARITARAATGADPSQATAEVAALLRARFAPWPQAQVVDTTRPLDATVDDVVERVSARRSSGSVRVPGSGG